MLGSSDCFSVAVWHFADDKASKKTLRKHSCCFNDRYDNVSSSVLMTETSKTTTVLGTPLMQIVLFLSFKCIEGPYISYFAFLREPFIFWLSAFDRLHWLRGAKKRNANASIEVKTHKDENSVYAWQSEPWQPKPSVHIPDARMMLDLNACEWTCWRVECGCMDLSAWAAW